MKQLSFHKQWFSLLVFFGLMWAGSALAQGWIHDVSGDVKAQIGTGPARAVAKTELVTNNTIITTGPKSFAILKFPDGQVIALKENSTFHVQNYQYDAKDPKKGNVLFSLLRGGVQAVTGAIGRDSRENWRLTTPVATAGIRGTSFIISEVGGQWFAQVAEGSVSLSTSTGTVTATVGQTFSISATGVLTPVAATAVPAGAFTQFQTFVLPAATPAAAPIAGAPVAGAAVGGLTGAAVGIAAAIAAAVAVAAAQNDETTTGTGTGTGTGTK